METKIEYLEMTADDKAILNKDLSVFKKSILTTFYLSVATIIFIFFFFEAKLMFFIALFVTVAIYAIYYFASKPVRDALQANKKIRIKGIITRMEVAQSASTVTYQLINDGRRVKYTIKHPSGVKNIEEDIDAPAFIREKGLFYSVFIGEEFCSISRELFFKLREGEILCLEKTESGIFLRNC